MNPIHLKYRRHFLIHGKISNTEFVRYLFCVNESTEGDFKVGLILFRENNIKVLNNFRVSAFKEAIKYYLSFVCIRNDKCTHSVFLNSVVKLDKYILLVITINKCRNVSFPSYRLWRLCFVSTFERTVELVNVIWYRSDKTVECFIVIVRHRIMLRLIVSIK